MKKILALAAVAALTAGVSAFAANPFSDVTPDDWAYQAISDLSDQGVVEGYPDGTFKGERNMTRYELAQIIARLMAREDQLNAEQRATLDKLAGEYSDELANLGVRVGNLEKKVGNLYWSGDARMRFNQSYKSGDSGDNKDSWNGRIRINVKGQVNDSTYVFGRLRSNMNFKDGKDANTVMDQLYVNHSFGDKVNVSLGRKSVYVGQTSIWFDDYIDGVIADVGDDNFKVEAGYGRVYGFKSAGYGTVFDSNENFALDKDGNVTGNRTSNSEMWYARVMGNAPRLSYDVEYYNINGHAFGKDTQKVWGAGLTAALTKQIDLFGDFYQNTAPSGDPEMWTAGLRYGHVNRNKPGSWDVSMSYVSAEKGSYLGLTTNHIDPQSLTYTHSGVDKVKYWYAQADVALQKNVTLHLDYAFDVDTDGSNKADWDDLAAAVINYRF